MSNTLKFTINIDGTYAAGAELAMLVKELERVRKKLRESNQFQNVQSSRGGGYDKKNGLPLLDRLRLFSFMRLSASSMRSCSSLEILPVARR